MRFADHVVGDAHISQIIAPADEDAIRRRALDDVAADHAVGLDANTDTADLARLAQEQIADDVALYHREPAAFVEVGHRDTHGCGVDDIVGDHRAFEGELGIERHFAQSRAGIGHHLAIGARIGADRGEGAVGDPVLRHKHRAGAEHVDTIAVLAGAATLGGTGQNGNGINVFRAGSVLVTQNRIADCAFSAIRTNSGSNCQMVSNSCTRLGEVALYAEFSFEGAVIANNIVDTAAMGISVTNFNEGGRLAVIQGNVIRNLFLRKTGEIRGIGIGVEADSVVSGNVIEGAPSYGILVGWGDYLRDVSVTDNVIRKAHIGIGVSVSPAAGTALITDNLIDGAKDGAIRAMKGPTPTGPDLARDSAEAYRNVAIYANVAREDVLPGRSASDPSS